LLIKNRTYHITPMERRYPSLALFANTQMLYYMVLRHPETRKFTLFDTQITYR
jgi:hypothetical protein